MPFRARIRNLIADAHVQRELWRHLDVVLREKCGVEVPPGGLNRLDANEAELCSAGNHAGDGPAPASVCIGSRLVIPEVGGTAEVQILRDVKLFFEQAGAEFERVAASHLRHTIGKLPGIFILLVREK